MRTRAEAMLLLWQELDQLWLCSEEAFWLCYSNILRALRGEAPAECPRQHEVCECEGTPDQVTED